MMWQDKQKVVVFERSSSLEMPIVAQSIGRISSAKKAITLPPLVAVIPGRTTNTAMRAILNDTSAMIRVVCKCIVM